MSATRRAPSWLERRDSTVRTLVWLDAGGSQPAPRAAAPLADGEPPAPGDVSASREVPCGDVEVLSCAGDVSSHAELLTRGREREIANEIEAALASAERELARVRGDLDEARRAADGHRLELEAARQDKVAFATATLRDAERELVQLATAVAARVIAREVEMAPELIVAWAREAIAGSNFCDALAIAASPDLEVRLPRAAWSELAPRVVTDASLPATTCELRARGSAITVSPAERLELVTAHVVETSEREAA